MPEHESHGRACSPFERGDPPASAAEACPLGDGFHYRLRARLGSTPTREGGPHPHFSSRTLRIGPDRGWR